MISPIELPKWFPGLALDITNLERRTYLFFTTYASLTNVLTVLHVCRLVDKQMLSEAEAVQLVYAGRVKEHEALARKKEWAYNSARWRANMVNYWYESAEMVYEAV